MRLALLLTLCGAVFASKFVEEPDFVDIRAPLLEKANTNVEDDSKAELVSELDQRLQELSLKWKEASHTKSNASGMNVAEVIFADEEKCPKNRLAPIWDPELTDAEFQRYKRMAQWSAASYCSEPSLLNWSCGPRCSGLTENTRVALYFKSAITDTVGFIATYVDMEREEDVIVIAFRGSVTFTNWVENLKFNKEASPWPDSSNPGARVHSGFLDSYADIASSIRAVIVMLLRRYPEARVLVTGHSLGGAVATLCAADLKYHLGQASKVELVTFHSPRVGNEAFASFINFIFKTSETNPEGGTYFTRRFTNKDDPMVHLPPSFLYFQHLNQEVWVNLEDETRACDPGLGEDPNCSNSVLLPDNIDSHFYIWDTKFGSDCSY